MKVMLDIRAQFVPRIEDVAYAILSVRETRSNETSDWQSGF